MILPFPLSVNANILTLLQRLMYVSDCSVILQNASGTIDFPTADECANNGMLPDKMSWEISLQDWEVAYLQFDEILFR